MNKSNVPQHTTVYAIFTQRKKCSHSTLKNDPHYIRRLEITEDNSEGMYVMKTIHEINAKLLNA